MMGPGTQNQEAYQLYLRGRFFFAQRTESGFRRAIENFQHAVALDPSYAQAYASLAIAYNVGRSYLATCHLRKQELFPVAKRKQKERPNWTRC